MSATGIQPLPGAVTPAATVAGASLAHGGQTAQGQNPWMSYFGPPSGPMATDAYDKYAHQNYDLPEAYKGKNLYLRDTINGLITDGSKPDFYTTVVLPWAQTDQITFAWNEFQFNETLAGRVPHEGISRLVTSSKRAKQDKSVRRGIAMILEHGFMSTAEGVEHYRRNLLGIAQCVQETANHDVMAALFSSDNYDRQWERDHGILSDGIRRVVSEEVYAFARLQKEANGLDIAVEQAKHRMGRYGAVPDTLIIPPKVSIYLTMVRPEKTQYFLAGPNGAKNLRNGPDALTSFRGLKVFETRGFDVYQGEPPIDIGLRRRQVGEYYIVMDNSTPREIFHNGWDQNNASTIVYDESIDNWRKISFAEMINHCGRYVNNLFESGMAVGSDGVLRKQPNKHGSAYMEAMGKRKSDFEFSQANNTPTSDGLQAFLQIQTAPTKMGQTHEIPPIDIMLSNAQETDEGVLEYYEASPIIGALSDEHVIDDSWHAKVAAAIEYNAKEKLDQRKFPKYGDFPTQPSQKHSKFTPFHGPEGGEENFAGSSVLGTTQSFVGTKHVGESNALVQAHLMQTEAIARELFDLQAQSHEFATLFSGASTINASETIDEAMAFTTVDAQGYTGVPALHMSFRGLKLIASNGQPKHAALAREFLNRINDIVVEGNSGFNGLAMYARSMLPSNYMYTADGSQPITITDEHAVKSVVFQVLTNSPCGHSLVPIDRNGEIQAAKGQLPGDSIVCPGFAIEHFKAARAGIVGALALTNVSCGILHGQNLSSNDTVHSMWFTGIGNNFTYGSYQNKRPKHVSASKSLKRSMPIQGGRNAAYQTNTGTRDVGGNPLAAAYSHSSLIGTHEQDPTFSQTAKTATRKPRKLSVFKGEDGVAALIANMNITTTISNNLQKVLNKFSSHTPELKARALFVLMTSMLHTEDLKSYVAKGYPLPFTFMLARPFIEHQMQTLVCMKAGPETGNTYYGHNSVTVGDDAVSKMHYVNLTFYSKAIVKESKNVYLLEDAFADGYIGGNDCKFFESHREVAQFEATEGKNSMFAFMIGTKEARYMPNPISISGEFGGVLDKDGTYAMQQKNLAGMHYSTANYYNAYFEFNNVVKTDPKRFTEMPRFQYDTKLMNTMCFQGAQFLYNSATDKFDVQVANTGHWGATYPGVKAVREGQTKHLESTGTPKFPVQPGSTIAPSY